MNIVPNWQKTLRLVVGTLVLLTSMFLPALAEARDHNRTLYLYYTHTKETAKITFKRNGRYDSKGLAELSYMLRDWRRNESIDMDPLLFDLVWETYQESGATGPIHVVSSYRSPATNEMLRSRSSAVAKGSRHTKGQALDFFIPGVSVKKLREIAMKKQTGGVGYYPASNSPFVHLDTGSVRAWPRMTKTQLARLFPDGKTIHVPNTGVPLSNKGYQLALADWKRCRTVPCSKRNTTRATTRVASTNNNSSSSSNNNSRTLFDLFFGGDKEEGTNNNNLVVANRADQTNKATAAINYPAPPKKAPIPAPTPMVRPNSSAILLGKAPTPASRPSFLNTATNNTPSLKPNQAIAAIDETTIAEPRILLTSPKPINSETVTAYAPEAISKVITSSLAEQPSKAQVSNINTAAISPNLENTKLRGLIESTWNVINLGQTIPVSIKPAPIVATPIVAKRKIELIAPDLEHVSQIFTDPSSLTSNRYAFIFEPDEADLNPATELGNYWQKIGFEPHKNVNVNNNKFKTGTKLIVASR